MDKDFSDQADMCEIVRALIASGKIDGAGDDVTNLNADIVDNINCVGGDGINLYLENGLGLKSLKDKPKCVPPQPDRLRTRKCGLFCLTEVSSVSEANLNSQSH